MRNWRSFYEILKYPLEVLFAGVILCGLGNLVTNPLFGLSDIITNTYARAGAEMLNRIGQFLIVNFPLLFLIRLSARRGGSANSIISSAAGYVAYLTATMFFTDTSLPSTSYSSILGLSISRSTVSYLANTSHYPLQTGIFGALITAAISIWSFNRTRRRNEYGFFSFLSKESACTIRTIFCCTLAGTAVAFGWPFLLKFIQRVVRFISVDTTNPINLALYGIMDRLLGTLHLGTLIRQPFWYSTNGGSWVNVAGISVAGDVNIWTAQLSANALTGMAGRFFTPYYVLNIFAVPAMIWSMFFLNTDAMERRRTWLLFLLGTLASWLSGTMLPLELMLVLLCPLLYMFHLLYTGVLYGLFQALHVYLGYYSTDTLTMSALPGTLGEFISYLRYPNLTRSLLIAAAVGAVSMVIYFFATRIYFKYLSVDLFRTGEKELYVNTTIKAIGGIENVKMVQSSISSLTVSVYDPNRMDLSRLRNIGSCRVYETRAGYTICFGAPSTMVRIAIEQAMRDSIRDVNNMQQ